MGGSGKGSSFIKRELKKTVRNTQNYGTAFQFLSPVFMKLRRFQNVCDFLMLLALHLIGTVAKPFI